MSTRRDSTDIMSTTHPSLQHILTPGPPDCYHNGPCQSEPKGPNNAAVCIVPAGKLLEIKRGPSSSLQYGYDLAATPASSPIKTNLLSRTRQTRRTSKRETQPGRMVLCLFQCGSIPHPYRKQTSFLPPPNHPPHACRYQPTRHGNRDFWTQSSCTNWICTCGHQQDLQSAG